MRSYLRAFRRVVLGTAGGLFVSGGLLVLTTLDLRLSWGMPWRLGADSRIGIVALHVGLAFAAMGCWVRYGAFICVQVGGSVSITTMVF